MASRKCSARVVVGGGSSRPDGADKLPAKDPLGDESAGVSFNGDDGDDDDKPSMGTSS